jgi:DNA replication protein DnaC
MNPSHLTDHLDYLKLEYIQREHRALAETAARDGWAHGDYLDRLVEGEVLQRRQRALERRLRLARFPYRKTLEQYQWSWPKKVNQTEIKQLFRLEFLQDHRNVVFVGPVGLGKTHLAVALGQAACEAGHDVLFQPAVAMINDLVAAQSQHRLKPQLRKYTEVSLLILDEVGYLPIDKTGADLMFQVLAARYEQASTILTTNRAYKHWPEIFNHDASLTAALLDRLLHHVCTIVIEGRSYRTKDQIVQP